PSLPSLFPYTTLFRSGRPVESLMRGGVITSKLAVADGATTRQALMAGMSWLTMATATLMSDTGRGAEKVGMARFRGVSYVRALRSEEHTSELQSRFDL